jgi:hypothetical protein
VKPQSHRVTESSAERAGARAGRFGAVPHLPHDDDERPSAQDLAYGQTIFNRTPVKLPRFLRGNGPLRH